MVLSLPRELRTSLNARHAMKDTTVSKEALRSLIVPSVTTVLMALSYLNHARKALLEARQTSNPIRNAPFVPRVLSVT